MSAIHNTPLCDIEMCKTCSWENTHSIIKHKSPFEKNMSTNRKKYVLQLD